ncbi:MULTISPECIES: YceH family protein [Luteimonas]|uniref:YceH family protein n=1 Tax=Luteimonas TaxID=83614 RepID=UPI000C7B9B30|nr:MULTISPECIES: YceH family protein [Luteimonas]
MTDSPDWPVLTAAEARVLGCLIEKQATTPDVYPLTVNAAQSAANQKTAREPVMALSPGDVAHALRQLEGHRLARQSFSSRAERYEHVTATALDLPSPQVALLGLLLLRGAQTVHELLARSERLHAFADGDDVRHHLSRLETGKALVVRIPRGPGQREDRYAHLLSGAVDIAAIAAKAGASSGPATADPALEARVEALEAELAALRETVETLAARLA